MVLNPEPLDVIMLLEFGAANHPLELVLQEVKPGQPAAVRKQLEALKIIDGLFVYSATDGEIVTAGEYLQKEPA